MSRATLQTRLDQGLAALGQTLAEDVRARLVDYVELLARWNAAYNLTAVRDPQDMVTRHLLDSLAIAPFVTGTTLADVGSGAGLPGLVLAIIAPERAVTLIDTNGKKSRFQREAVRSLRLDNVEVIHARVEQVEGTFDCVTARAFASLGDMLTWGGHLLAANGRWLAMKGRRPDDELTALPDGFRLEREHEVTVPGLDAERRLLVLARSDAP
ncbi:MULTISPECIES: 16S rRNA (guanine(527)-N(7))-methyltransferase RsmG [Oleiagrimonas]|uniref:Ribosomal RNA small subunit methyltransferase G n=1 Tax=Oleiagrimonas citrea TaxID=1665687 RepID=A0A846ZQQ6_9GAMM|nr:MULTISPECIES: 16S rRNA (guanine(527)-N(7))-methyltransferase RsmG [Oleiagrimonas]NKZ39910.1 16S rRNA (guanine(527)-N(7))-methyltransferase RsmG [Oleiagrimonas citrea]RAP56950.1 16S rRNA (guanine(527)-N(7))-methyltransferase RsmG [Oleiagrimonas sp. MCCC 1A03011]